MNYNKKFNISDMLTLSTLILISTVILTYMVNSESHIYYYLPVEFKVNSTFDMAVSNSLTLVTPHLYLIGLPLLVISLVSRL